MVKMNEKMKEILKQEESCFEVDFALDNIVDDIVDNTKIIKDCIIYDPEGILEEHKIDFERIIQFCGDWTGYEVSCNELKIEKEKIVPSQFIVFAEQLSNKLSLKYNAKQVVIYISLDDEVELRFHTFRKKEQLWLDEDLNKYDFPILCWQ